MNPSPVRISDNSRFLVDSNGAPFFYLADTAWELFHRLRLDEAEYYLRRRAAQGFTVIQAVILAELDGLTTPNANGDLPLDEGDPARPNEAYFAHVDAVFDLAERFGLAIALLPTWGDKWNLGWGPGPAIFTPANAYDFGRYVGARYRDRHVIWVTGGDRTIDDDRHLAIVRATATGLRDGDGGRNLVTMHTMGQHSTREFVADEQWIDFHTIQSGHGRNFPNWTMIERDYAATPVKPCLDMEPIYEEAPEGIRNLDGGFADDYEVRKAMYWSLFSGAHGHTYGCWPVWQMWDIGRVPIMWVRRSWREALELPGAHQVAHAKALMLSRPYLDRIPDPSILRDGDGDGSAHIVATRDRAGTYAMLYVPAGSGPFRPGGGEFLVDTSVLSGEGYRAWWFDPRTGATSDAGVGPCTPLTAFTAPAGGPDWILVIDADAADYARPGDATVAH